jgi:hypothetical protein
MGLATSSGITARYRLCSTSRVWCNRLIPFPSTQTFCPAATSRANETGQRPVLHNYHYTGIHNDMCSRMAHAYEKSVPMAEIVAFES